MPKRHVAHKLQLHLMILRKRLLERLYTGSSLVEVRSGNDLNCICSHTGKRIPAEQLQRYEEGARTREEEISRIQLKHIHLAAQVRLMFCSVVMQRFR